MTRKELTYIICVSSFYMPKLGKILRKKVKIMWYVLGGMATGAVCIVAVELFVGKLA